MQTTNSEIIFYQNQEGDIQIEVQLENETVWLTQAQMAELFNKARTTITEHIRNVFKEGELDENSVCRKFRHTADDGKTYETNYYNLDVIISVGYRVKSKQGTQFRIWANNILKQYIIKGYAIQDNIKIEQYKSLRQTVHLLANVLQNKELSADEATGLLTVVTDFNYALDILDKYDHQALTIDNTSTDQLTLMIAESKPNEKDIMVSVVVNLINGNN